jgi:hypothetical protein
MRYDKIIYLLLFLATLGCDNANDSSTSMQSVGQGGSTTRYTIQNNYLYVVDDVSLRVFNIVGDQFEQIHIQQVGFGVETIFSRPDYLYLGASDGMYIYSIENPAQPEFVFRYSHIVACDPVVVQGNRAYVTLNTSGTGCNRGINALDIIDITDRYNPSLVKRYEMTSPRGLGVDGSYLFISEGPHGLKVLNITNEMNPVVLESISNIHAFDVIAREGRLTVTGEDGIFQYMYPDDDGPSILSLLSKIPVNRQ